MQKTGRVTSGNLALPAGGIRRPHRLRFAPAARQRLFVMRQRPYVEVWVMENGQRSGQRGWSAKKGSGMGSRSCMGSSDAFVQPVLIRNFWSDVKLALTRQNGNRHSECAPTHVGSVGHRNGPVVNSLGCGDAGAPSSLPEYLNHPHNMGVKGRRRITLHSRRAAFAALTPLRIWGGVRECMVVMCHMTPRTPRWVIDAIEII